MGCFLLAWLPTSELGQREHLAVVLVAPYLVMAARRLDGEESPGWEAAAVGLAGGLGFALKPFFLLPLVLVEGGIFLVRRRLDVRGRPELIAALLLLGTYPLAVAVIAPDYFDIVRTYWPAYRRFFPVTAAEAIGHGVTRPWIGMAAAVLAGLGWHFRRWGLELVVALAVMGFGAAAMVQQRAWLYLWLPMLILGWALLILVLARTRELATGRVAASLRAAAVLAVVAVMAGYSFRWATVATEKIGHASRPASYYQVVRRLVAECARGQAVAVLSPFHAPAFPAILDGGGRWNLRFNSLWPLAAAIPGIGGPGPIVHALPGAAGSPANRAARATAADLLAAAPKLLLVPALDTAARNPAGYQRIDFLAILATEPRIADLLGSYHEIGRAGVFRVLMRGGEPPCSGAAL